ncbi:MAG TPA: PAS domain S-box protein [Opitutaceae bacterium]|nr:PAS domain S-box protein [Opitutaceae bacterium]
MKILIVDDNSADRKVLRYMVERNGHEALEAENGLAGMQVARSTAPDLIISDVLMPVMDGFHFIREAKQDPVVRVIPFVFYSSSYIESRDVRLTMSLGATAHFNKPMEPVELWTKLAPLLAKKEKAPPPTGPLIKEDAEYLKRYSEVVATKLEEKVHELEQTLAERQRVEAALRESEKRYKQLLDSVTDYIYTVRIQDGRAVATAHGPGCAAVTGYAPEDYAADPELWHRMIYEPDRPLVREQAEHLLAGEAVRPLEHRLIHRDGTLRWVRHTPVLHFDAQRRPIAYDGLIEDITERRRAEEAVHKLSLAVEQSPASIIITDTAGNIEYANLRFSELTGYSRAEVLGRNPRFLKSGQTTREEYKRMWQAITAGHEWHGEFYNRKKNGECFWETVAISPIRDPHGNITHFLAIKEDVTAHRRDQERIREQATLLDQTQDAVLVLGLDRRFRYCNRSVVRSYGLTVEQVIESDAAQLLFPDAPARCAEVCRTTLDRGTWTGEIAFANTLGGRRLALSRWTLICDDAGRPSSFLVVNTDITEQKRLEEQFLRTQRMESIGTLASGVAHDLNNILAPILLSTGLLRTAVTEAEDIETLDVIEQCAQRGTAVINQLLTYGRGIEGEKIPVQMRALLKEMANVVRETFPKNITLVQHIPSELWLVQANPTQLHQVLLNLCVNSRDAMPSGGTLTLAAENVLVDAAFASMHPEAKPGPHVVLQVSDTGTGIPPEVMPKIFDPFFTTKALGKGTGLGLSTVIGIVRSHAGFVLVDSQLGKGTQFSIYLPAEVSTEKIESSAPTERLPSGHGELILVVDDEESIRGMTRRALIACGYRVAAAADGAEAMHLLSKSREPFAAVITDMIMPVMDGAALIRALRGHRADLAIVAVCGIPEQEAVAVQAGLGNGAFITKPFSSEQLIKTLQRVLEPRTATAAAAPGT